MDEITTIKFRVYQSDKQELKDIAEQNGETLSDFIRESIDERVERLNDEYMKQNQDGGLIDVTKDKEITKEMMCWFFRTHLSMRHENLYVVECIAKDRTPLEFQFVGKTSPTKNQVDMYVSRILNTSKFDMDVYQINPIDMNPYQLTLCADIQ